MISIRQLLMFAGTTEPKQLEVPFDLPDASSPLTPFAYTPTLGAVKLLLPGAGGAWVDVAVDHQLVKGNGGLAAQLTSAQAVTPGSAYIYAYIAGAQPFVDQFEIVDPATYLTDPNQGELAFDLPDATTPLTPFAGGAYNFVLDDVMLALPGGAWLPVPLAQIATKGFGAYAVQLTAAQKATPGKAYVYAVTAGAQPFLGAFDIPSLENFTARTAFPALAITTTAESIRDRMIAVIGALVPRSIAGDAFMKYLNEGGADFQAWCEANPAAARRRFQVRDTGDDQPPEVSNTDIEERMVTFRILVAYPQDSRDGADAALDRDDAMSLDQHQIEHNVGMCGRQNFCPPYPDACWRSGKTRRIVGTGVDFLEITQTMSFQRSML